MTKSNPYLYTPARAGAVSIEEYERRAKDPLHLDWKEQDINDYLINPMPGDFMVGLGRPGHGKTTFMVALLKYWNRKLQGTNKVLFVSTWETLIEELVAIITSDVSGQDMATIGSGKADLTKVKHGISDMVLHGNMAFIGRSMERLGDDRSVLNTMHRLDDVHECLQQLVRMDMQPVLGFFDYIQRIPGQRGQDRSSAVSENADLIKDLAIANQVATFAMAQAKRDVDEYKGVKLPLLADGQWASTIEQSADKVFGFTRPNLYIPGEEIEVEATGDVYEVYEEMFIMAVLKQRWAKAGKRFFLHLDPAKFEFGMAAPSSIDF